eukprot:GILJ01000218.1.p1 GENE.GILJ01000218.1~~GILJ01000218.1.p1  ORF type:complete len:231 (-),score=28.36 GILJ01000218.1:146-838(-)
MKSVCFAVLLCFAVLPCINADSLRASAVRTDPDKPIIPPYVFLKGTIFVSQGADSHASEYTLQFDIRNKRLHSVFQDETFGSTEIEYVMNSTFMYSYRPHGQYCELTAVGEMYPDIEGLLALSEYAGDETIDDKLCHKWRAVTPAGGTVDLTVDATTGELKQFYQWDSAHKYNLYIIVDTFKSVDAFPEDTFLPGVWWNCPTTPDPSRLFPTVSSMLAMFRQQPTATLSY